MLFNKFLNLDPVSSLIPVSPKASKFQDCMSDLVQRSILFMDTMRQRGNEMLAMTKDNSSTVLNFAYEKISDGVDFSRPINYWLARMLPPEGSQTDPLKRPYVIQDPRAGQGPGIGGFKPDSEIGDALRNGHPVYFIGFNASPIEGQSYEDVIKGQLKFYETVAELHPNSPKMCAIGNCAAGYLSMFSAMQRPDIFGPILIAGSPLSYWNGKRGKNPMRYAAGLVGGSWINSWLGDLGGGKFDGSYLILNFDLLNPANFLWTKQYNLFAHIDDDGERYLHFEKWWGDFIQFNPAEIKWLVDKLFIGNQLTSGQLVTEDGIRLDPRLITSPLITFVSDGDNISPPAQSAGWIADLYHDTDEIIARGKTIVYCLNHKVGHLAIFTASKVGRREDEVFVENMDSIDILPPGLYELVIDTPEGQEQSGKLRSHYEARTIQDIKALGCNSQGDDRAFATVAKASESISLLYDKMVQPLFKMLANPQSAEFSKNLRPLRMSYSLFADRFNPWMKYYALAATQVGQQRVKLAATNPLLMNEAAKLLTEYLQNYTSLRDGLKEELFFSIWANPWVQRFWGTYQQTPRITPSMSQLDRQELFAGYNQQIKANLSLNNAAAALIRFVAIVVMQRTMVDEYVVRILIQETRCLEPSWDDRQIHEVIKAQVMVVRSDMFQAVSALHDYLHTANNCEIVGAILSATASQVLSQLGGEIPDDARLIIQQLVAKLGLPAIVAITSR